jgi:hypothetical protein
MNGNVLNFVEKSKRHEKGQKRNNNECYYVIGGSCGYEPRYAPWYLEPKLVGLTKVKFFLQLWVLKKESSKKQPLLRCDVEEIIPFAPFLFLFLKWLCSCGGAQIEG